MTNTVRSIEEYLSLEHISFNDSFVHVAKPPHREQMLSDDGFKDNLTTSETDSPSPKSMPAAVRISVCVSSFVCMSLCISVK